MEGINRILSEKWTIIDNPSISIYTTLTLNSNDPYAVLL